MRKAYLHVRGVIPGLVRKNQDLHQDALHQVSIFGLQ